MKTETDHSQAENQATTTSWFRDAAPYIHAHAGSTFVVAFDGETIASAGIDNLIHDLAILNSLGIRLVLVFGARHQIENSCREAGVAVHYHEGLRITDEASLTIARRVIGELRIDIESRLSFGLPHTPMADARIRCVSGNLVNARPAGIRDGVDLGHTGEVRRVDQQAIKQHLDNHNMVLLPPLGYSLTGEIFNLSAEAIATATAISLSADKLIFIGERSADLPRELTIHQAQQQIALHDLLPSAIDACLGGVQRVHLINRDSDGALLQELFSRDGAGTLISATSFETTRQATIEDVVGILELIEPLEANGSLVKRSRDQLEREISHFTVMERDGTVVACAALYPYPANQMAELACLAVSPDYQDAGRGQTLLNTVEKQAIELGCDSLYVLTTQTTHWFFEHGFQASEIADLPVEKQAMYNYQRKARVFRKKLS